MDLKGGLNLIVSFNNMQFLGSNGPLGGSEGADLIHTPEMMGGVEGGRGGGGQGWAGDPFRQRLQSVWWWRWRLLKLHRDHGFLCLRKVSVSTDCSHSDCCQQ